MLEILLFLIEKHMEIENILKHIYSIEYIEGNLLYSSIDN